MEKIETGYPVGHILPGTRDYIEAYSQLKEHPGQQQLLYESYEQVLQKNVLIRFNPEKDKARVAEIVAAGMAMAQLTDDPEASTVVGVYLVYMED